MKQQKGIADYRSCTSLEKEIAYGTRIHYVAVRSTPCGYYPAVYLPCYLGCACRMSGAAAKVT